MPRPIVITRFSIWIMKPPDKHFVAATGIVIATACLIALTWIGTLRTIHTERARNIARVTATLANQALTFTEQIGQQTLALDQTLRILATAWAANPAGFDLSAWHDQAVALNGLSRDMVLTDENGIIRQSSVNEAIGQNVSGLDYFRALADPSDPGEEMYIGPAAIDGIMRQWHLNVARSLHHPDGSFAGVIDTDYRIAAITDVFSETDLGAGAFLTLIGLDDGKLRGAVGPATIDPGASVGDTPMFAAMRGVAMRGGDSGIWTGPSANDAVPRIHAFRQIPGRKLAVIVAMNEVAAMQPVTIWRRDVEAFAGFITALLACLALVLIHGTRLARRRDVLVVENRAVLAAANAQLEVARALASAKAEQLEAALAGMSDGVSMFDAHLCLVEWNKRFPDLAGVPAEILRAGLPMEQILRAQIRTGQFGPVSDPEAEVERRMARLRVAPFGVVQRQRPDGRTLEVRRNRLPDGGFVTRYADITEHKLAEQALREAKAAAETAQAEKSRFIAIVSHEIRTPLDALLNAIRLLGDSVLAPAQKSLLAMARQSGDVLLGVIGDIRDLSQMEAGKLAIRPSLFELRPLLDSCVAVFAEQAAARGITVRVAIAAGTPATLLTDSGRLRQVQLALLSNAMKYARPGALWLTAEPGDGAHEAVRLTVKDAGPAIAPAARERLFRPFAGLDRPAGDDPAGTGLGLSLCRHLVTLLGGAIGCDTWRAKDGRSKDGRSEDGRDGNAFWITLPATALPLRTAPWPSDRAIGMSPAGSDQAGSDQAGSNKAGSDQAGSDQAGADQVGADHVGAGQANADQVGFPPADRDGAPRVGVPLAGSVAGIVGLSRRSPPRTRVLLTEDIVANQVVTATLLRREGHHVDIAASGPEAIQAIKATPYDLVFMDIFMPGMGGQEATQIIRTLPEPARSMPIVALTGNIGPEDETIFRAAGMDDVVGKPVSLAELLGVLDRHVWSAPAAATAPPSPAAATATPIPSGPKGSSPHGANVAPVLAAGRIEELRTNLPPATFASLVEECLLDMDHRLPALRRALAAGAPGAIAAHAHALLGMAAGYGMAAMEVRLRAIMAAAREGDLTPLGPAVVAALEADFAEAARTLRDLLRKEAV